MTYTFPEAKVGLVETLRANQIRHVQVKVVEIHFPSRLSAICHLRLLASRCGTVAQFGLGAKVRIVYAPRYTIDAHMCRWRHICVFDCPTMSVAEENRGDKGTNR